MRSTAHKCTTHRTAQAQAVLRCEPALLQVLRDRNGLKGDALEVAKVAATMAAKKTWEIIPYCHPLPLDHVAIDYRFEERAVVVIAAVTAVWKTGVEMEALLAAQVAAATLFDMLKPYGTAMTIDDVQVLEKQGGTSSYREELPAGFRAAVVVTSDGTAAGTRKDRSGQLIRERLQAFGISDVEYLILPDERELVQHTLQTLAQRGVHLVVTTGGTGLGPRDVTVDATRSVIDTDIPGIMEAARAFGQQRTPYAMLSRGLAGLCGGTLIVNLPGSSRGTAESLDAIFPAILHSYHMMAGGGHGHVHG